MDSSGTEMSRALSARASDPPAAMSSDEMSDEGEVPMQITVFSLVSNLSKGLKAIKMRALEAEARTQAATSLLDEENLTRNEISRKNEIAQGGDKEIEKILLLCKILF